MIPQDNLPTYKRYFEDARDANDKQRSEALIDRDYFDGHQWTEAERQVLEARKQPPLYFNEVKVAIRGLVPPFRLVFDVPQNLGCNVR